MGVQKNPGAFGKLHIFYIKDNEFLIKEYKLNSLMVPLFWDTL